MHKLSNEELNELYFAICERIPERFFDALNMANENHELDKLLNLMNLNELIPIEKNLPTLHNGKIYLFGDTQIKKNDILGIVKKYCIDSDRLEFVDFNKCKTFNYNSLKNTIHIAAILFGAMPHKTSGSGDFSSVIINIESHPDTYPPAFRLTANNSLKITKTSFKNCLIKLIDEGIVE